MSPYYSQSGEDVILSELFKNQEQGFFVEVGCIDGRRFSNTLTFEERGWNGLCVEAHAGYINLLKNNRPRSIIAHCAAGEQDEDGVIFYSNSRGSLSTLDASKENHFRTHYKEYFTGFEPQHVNKRRLDSLFKQYNISAIDILSLDIEGSEVSALKGIDLDIFRPRVFVIEADGRTDEEALDGILVPKGYTKIYRLGGNIFYLSDSHSISEDLISKQKIKASIINTRHPHDAGGEKNFQVELEPLPKSAASGRFRFCSNGFHGDLYLQQLIDALIKDCDVFIETGTNVGSTLAYVARTYPQVQCLSCEPDLEAYNEAVLNVPYPQVKIFNETSQEFLQRLDKQYRHLYDKKCLFWLDSHGYGFTWPLKEEVAFFTGIFKRGHLFIDDFKVPGMDCFGYDAYQDQECSFDYIRKEINQSASYKLYYPNYSDRTSTHHPLRGWCLIEYGHAEKLPCPAELFSKIRTGYEYIMNAASHNSQDVSCKREIMMGKNDAMTAALMCKGWTDEGKLSGLYDLAQKTAHCDGDILEIGSAWGRSAVFLGLVTERIIWSIDPHTGGLAYIQKGELQNSYDEFIQNISRNALSSRIKALRMTTQEAADKLMVPDSTHFSFVFIDGLHTAEGVKTDFQFTYPRLVEGGFMAFDDYFEPTVRDYADMIDTLATENGLDLKRDRKSRLVFFQKPHSQIKKQAGIVENFSVNTIPMHDEEEGQEGSIGISNPAIINAFIAKLDNPFLISFPRTGSHWLRMIMELYFEKPSLVRIFYNRDAKEFTCFHRHDVELTIQRPNVLYLYRNPIDTVYSQLRYHKEDHHDVARIQYWAELYGRHLSKWLIDENFTTKKSIVTYEGMKRDINSEFLKVCKHFNEPFDAERLRQAFDKVSKLEVKKKTLHDQQVMHLDKSYEEERNAFRLEHNQRISDTVLRQNPRLENYLNPPIVCTQHCRIASTEQGIANNKNKLVRIVKNWDEPDLRRQTPQQKGSWDGIEFTFDPVEKCDYALVLNYAPGSTTVTCPPQNVWAMMQEPFVPDMYPWLVSGHEHFTKVFTPHRMKDEQKYIYTQTCLPWHVNKTYDELVSCPLPQKTKLISWITSSKQFFPGHKARMKFFDVLQSRPDLTIDLFGRQIRPLKDKWDGLAPYKYSLAIENSASPHYWTEKIADCFLSFTLPIYYGCTNLEDYFPKDSFVRIDIENPEWSIKIIKDILRDDVWERRLDAIREARALVLNKYQLFPFIATQIRSEEKKNDELKSGIDQIRQKNVALADVSPPNTAHFFQPLSDGFETTPSLEPVVSIIILNYNGLADLRTCLDSIKRNTPEHHEIIVFDNASNDGSQEYLRTLPDITLAESPKNLGCPPARAQAIALAKGDYIVFLDNDTIVTKNWITSFLSHAKKDPRIGIIGPRSNYVSGAQIVPNVTYKDVSELEQFSFKFTAQNNGQLTFTTRLVGFCMFIRRAVVNKIGNIDASFGKFGFEDDDYTWRAHIAGFKIAIANDVFIHHTGGPQGRGNQQYNRLLLNAWEVFKRKWKLPPDLAYGSPFDLTPVLSRPFDPKKHYIHLAAQPNPATVIRGAAPRGAALKISCQDNGIRKKVPGLVSIIIRVSGDLDSDKKCFHSIEKYTQTSHEILLIAPCTMPFASKWAKNEARRKENVRYIACSDSRSFAREYNQGIQEAFGEYVLLLDPKVIVTENWLALMLECLACVPRAGIIGPMTDGGDGVQKIPCVEKNMSTSLLNKFTASFRNKNRHRRVQVDSLAYYCLLFKRDLTETIGLLDENLGQDANVAEDYCLRSVTAERSNFIAGDVFVHYSRADMQRDKKLFNEKWKTIDAQSTFGRSYIAAKAVERAREHYEKDEVDKAITALMDGIAQAPAEKMLYLCLAEFLIDARRFQDALEAITSMPEKAKNDMKTLELIGYCKYGLDFFDESQEEAARMLALEPNSATALNLSGMVAYKKGDTCKAERFFSQAASNDPGYGEPHTNLGVLRWVTDKKDDALEFLEKGFILSPTLADVITLYHSAICATGEFARAEKIFQDAKALHPKNRKIAFLLIDLLIKNSHYDRALHEIEQAMVFFGIDDGMLTAALEVRGKVGPHNMKPASQKDRTISLCMIVKNEEQYLAKCLASVKPVVHEMIVVDTGSEDRTRDIARAFGAKVHDFTWTNDFAAARNFSLEQASGDLALVMDADEVISTLDYPFFHRLATGVKPIAYSFNTRNYTDTPGLEGWSPNDEKYSRECAGCGWIPSRKVRLFTNDPSIRFVNPVHEIVEPSLQDKGVIVQHCEVPIHHYGRLDQGKLLAKHEKYYALGKKKLAKQMHDIKAVMELAIQAAELQKHEEALELWKSILDRYPDDPLVHYNMGCNYLALKRYREALFSSRRANELAPARKEAVTNFALSELLVGDLDNAVVIVRDVVAKNPAYPIGLALLATMCCITGDKGSGRRHFEKLRAMNFNFLPFIHDTATRLIECNRLEFAEKLISVAKACGYTNHAIEILGKECESKLIAGSLQG